MDEFKGELDDIDPKLLINKTTEDEFENFFLTLGLIFNDLKGIVVLARLFMKTYKEPDLKLGPTVHMGEYQGIKNQLYKYTLSAIYEALLFFRENKHIIHTTKFQLLLNGLPKQTKGKWNRLVDDATSPGDKKDLYSRLAQIRNNISFHFNKVKKSEIRKGYLDMFFGDTDGGAFLNKAYFSLGNNMEKTRFYFSDAAIQGYIRTILKTEDHDEAFRLIEDIASTIHQIMGAYMGKLKNKR